MIRGDPHTHTTISDSILTPGQTVLIAAQSGLDYLALTDHNLTPFYDTYNFAMDALYRTPYEGRVAVFKGGEFDIKYRGRTGHVAAFFSDSKNCRQLERSTIKMLHPEKGEADLITFAKWVRDENGVMLITHPNQFGLICFSINLAEQAFDEINQAGIVVAKGMEIITATARVAFPREIRPRFNLLNKSAKKAGVAPMGASDAHLAELIGMAYTISFANSDINNAHELFDDVQKSVLLTDTIPAWRPKTRNPWDNHKLGALLAFCELLKVGGRKVIKTNRDCDPFYASRLLETVLGMINPDNFCQTRDLKTTQQAHRLEILAELSLEDATPRRNKQD